ncbi:MAG: polysaccharide biosynthesis tyrosine autokinase [Microbacterium sp.]
MDLKDYVGALKRRWYFLVALTLLGGALAYGYGALQPEQYRAEANAFVSSQRGETVSELVQGSQYTANLMQSYARLALTPSVLNPVIDEMGLDLTLVDLQAKLTSEVELNTVILSISAIDTDPQRAADIANNVVDSLAEAVRQLAPQDADGNPSVALTTVTTATPPTVPFAPNKSLLAATGALVGLIIAILYAVLKSAFDTRIRDEEDIARIADVPILGTTPARRLWRRGGARPAAVEWQRSASTREAFRRIAANLDFADLDRQLRVAVVTSALPADGKTTTSAYLALALAERNHRVLAIDGDLRHPRLGEVFGVSSDVGLTSVLRQQLPLEDAVQPIADRNVDVLASGTRPPNPTEVLNSQAMKTLLDQARERYDFVVIDSAPVLAVSDTLTLSRVIGATILVGRYNATRRQNLRSAMESIESTGARLLGVVLNAIPESRHSLSYYGEEQLLLDRAHDDTAASGVRTFLSRRSRTNPNTTEKIGSGNGSPAPEPDSVQ